VVRSERRIEKKKVRTRESKKSQSCNISPNWREARTVSIEKPKTA